MKLRTIRLENIRRFTDPVEISGIGDGLNVLSAPNEHGKSTVFDALHAVFFKPRKSWDKEIRSLVPHAGGDPSVAVEIELADGIYRIEKRWSGQRNGDARIQTAGRLIKQADDAEVWIAKTLKAPKDGGPAGILWVRQGLTGLDDGNVSRLARRDLLTSVAGEVEAMTGGRRMDAARDRCLRELGLYLTATGRKKADGPLKRQEDAIDSLREKRLEHATTSDQLRHELDCRRKLRRELTNLENPEEREERNTRLAKAKAAHADASHHDELLKRAKREEYTKRVEAGRAKEQLDLLNRDLTELAEAAEAHRIANERAQQAVKQLRLKESQMTEAENVRNSSRDRAGSASDTLTKVLLAESAAVETERRQELAEKIERAGELRQWSEQASAEVRTELSDAVLERLEGLDESVRVLRRAHNFEAVAIAMTYAPGRSDGVSLSGEPLPSGERISIPDGARLEIDDIGRLDIHPGQRPGGETLANTERELAEALEAAGVKSIEDARASGHRRRAAELRARNAEADLQGVAPSGIDVLRDQLSKIPERFADEDDLPTAQEAQQEHEMAREALTAALEEYEAVRTAHQHVHTAAVQANTAAESAGARVERAKEALSGIDDPQAERTARREALAHLRTELEDATHRRKEAEADTPDLEAAASALERARSIVQSANKRRDDIRLGLVKLDTSIGIQADKAVDEELADIDVRLEAALTAHASLEFEGCRPEQAPRQP